MSSAINLTTLQNLLNQIKNDVPDESISGEESKLLHDECGFPSVQTCDDAYINAMKLIGATSTAERTAVIKELQKIINEMIEELSKNHSSDAKQKAGQEVFQIFQNFINNPDAAKDLETLVKLFQQKLAEIKNTNIEDPADPKVKLNKTLANYINGENINSNTLDEIKSLCEECGIDVSNDKKAGLKRTLKFEVDGKSYTFISTLTLLPAIKNAYREARVVNKADNHVEPANCRRMDIFFEDDEEPLTTAIDNVTPTNSGEIGEGSWTTSEIEEAGINMDKYGKYFSEVYSNRTTVWVRFNESTIRADFPGKDIISLDDLKNAINENFGEDELDQLFIHDLWEPYRDELYVSNCSGAFIQALYDQFTNAAQSYYAENGIDGIESYLAAEYNNLKNSVDVNSEELKSWLENHPTGEYPECSSIEKSDLEELKAIFPNVNIQTSTSWDNEKLIKFYDLNGREYVYFNATGINNFSANEEQKAQVNEYVKQFIEGKMPQGQFRDTLSSEFGITITTSFSGANYIIEFKFGDDSYRLECPITEANDFGGDNNWGVAWDSYSIDKLRADGLENHEISKYFTAKSWINNQPVGFMKNDAAWAGIGATNYDDLLVKLGHTNEPEVPEIPDDTPPVTDENITKLNNYINMFIEGKMPQGRFRDTLASELGITINTAFNNGTYVITFDYNNQHYDIRCNIEAANDGNSSGDGKTVDIIDEATYNTLPAELKSYYSLVSDINGVKRYGAINSDSLSKLKEVYDFIHEVTQNTSLNNDDVVSTTTGGFRSNFNTKIVDKLKANLQNILKSKFGSAWENVLDDAIEEIVTKYKGNTTAKVGEVTAEFLKLIYERLQNPGSVKPGEPGEPGDVNNPLLILVDPEEELKDNKGVGDTKADCNYGAYFQDIGDVSDEITATLNKLKDKIKATLKNLLGSAFNETQFETIFGQTVNDVATTYQDITEKVAVKTVVDDFINRIYTQFKAEIDSGLERKRQELNALIDRFIKGGCSVQDVLNTLQSLGLKLVEADPGKTNPYISDKEFHEDGRHTRQVIEFYDFDGNGVCIVCEVDNNGQIEPNQTLFTGDEVKSMFSDDEIKRYFFPSEWRSGQGDGIHALQYSKRDWPAGCNTLEDLKNYLTNLAAFMNKMNSLSANVDSKFNFELVKSKNPSALYDGKTFTAGWTELNADGTPKFPDGSGAAPVYNAIYEAVKSLVPDGALNNTEIRNLVNMVWKSVANEHTGNISVKDFTDWFKAKLKDVLANEQQVKNAINGIDINSESGYQTGNNTQSVQNITLEDVKNNVNLAGISLYSSGAYISSNTTSVWQYLTNGIGNNTTNLKTELWNYLKNIIGEDKESIFGQYLQEAATEAMKDRSIYNSGSCSNFYNAQQLIDKVIELVLQKLRDAGLINVQGSSNNDQGSSSNLGTQSYSESQMSGISDSDKKTYFEYDDNSKTYKVKLNAIAPLFPDASDLNTITIAQIKDALEKKAFNLETKLGDDYKNNKTVNPPNDTTLNKTTAKEKARESIRTLINKIKTEIKTYVENHYGYIITNDELNDIIESLLDKAMTKVTVSDFSYSYNTKDVVDKFISELKLYVNSGSNNKSMVWYSATTITQAGFGGIKNDTRYFKPASSSNYYYLNVKDLNDKSTAPAEVLAFLNKGGRITDLETLRQAIAFGVEVKDKSSEVANVKTSDGKYINEWFNEEKRLTFKIDSNGNIVFVKAEGDIFTADAADTKNQIFKDLKEALKTTYSNELKAIFGNNTKAIDNLFNIALLQTISGQNLWNNVKMETIMKAVMQKFVNLMKKVKTDANAMNYVKNYPSQSLLNGTTGDSIEGSATGRYYVPNTTGGSDDWISIKTRTNATVHKLGDEEFPAGVLVRHVGNGNDSPDDKAINDAIDKLLGDYIKNYKSYMTVEAIISKFNQAVENALKKLESGRTSGDENVYRNIYGYGDHNDRSGNTDTYRDDERYVSVQACILQIMYETEILLNTYVLET